MNFKYISTLRPAWQELSPEAQDLIKNMLKVDPSKRFSIEECLQHPWIQGNSLSSSKASASPIAAFQLASAVQAQVAASEQVKHNRHKVLTLARASVVKRAENRVQRHKKLIEELTKLHG